MFARKKVTVKKQATPLGGSELKKLRKQLTQMFRARASYFAALSKGTAAASEEEAKEGEDVVASLVEYLLSPAVTPPSTQQQQQQQASGGGSAAAVSVVQLSVPVATAASDDGSAQQQQQQTKKGGKNQQQQKGGNGPAQDEACVNVYCVKKGVALLFELDKWCVKNAVLSPLFAETIIDDELSGRTSSAASVSAARYVKGRDSGGAAAKLQDAFAAQWAQTAGSGPAKGASKRACFDSFQPPESPSGSFLFPTCFFFALVDEWVRATTTTRTRTTSSKPHALPLFRSVEVNDNTSSYVMQGANLMQPGVRGVAAFPNALLLDAAAASKESNADDKEGSGEDDVEVALGAAFVESLMKLRSGFVPVDPLRLRAGSDETPSTALPPCVGEVVALGAQYNTVPFALGIYCLDHTTSATHEEGSPPQAIRYAQTSGVSVRLLHTFGDALCLQFLPDFVASRRSAASSSSSATANPSAGSVPEGYEAALTACLSSLSAAQSGSNKSAYMKPQFTAFVDKRTGREHGAVGVEPCEAVLAGVTRLVKAVTPAEASSLVENEEEEGEDEVDGTGEEDDVGEESKKQQQEDETEKHVDPTEAAEEQTQQQQEQQGEAHEDEKEEEQQEPARKLTMDEAVTFALMEAVGSLNTAELPQPVNQFYPQRVIKALPHASWVAAPTATAQPTTQKQKGKQKPYKGNKDVGKKGAKKGGKGKADDDNEEQDDEEDQQEGDGKATSPTATSAVPFDIKHTSFKKTIKLFQVAHEDWGGVVKLKEASTGQFVIDAVNKNARVYREHRACYYDKGVPNLKLRAMYSRYGSSSNTGGDASSSSLFARDDNNDDDDDDSSDSDLDVGDVRQQPSHRIFSLAQEFWMDEYAPNDQVLRSLLRGTYTLRDEEDEDEDEEQEEEGGKQAVTPKQVKDALDHYVTLNKLRHRVRTDVIAAAVFGEEGGEEKAVPTRGCTAVWDADAAATATATARAAESGVDGGKKGPKKTQVMSIVEINDELRNWLPENARCVAQPQGMPVRWMASSVAAAMLSDNILQRILESKCVLRFLPLSLNLDKQIGLHSASKMQGYDAEELAKDSIERVEFDTVPPPIRLAFALRKGKSKRGSKKRHGTTMVIGLGRFLPPTNAQALTEVAVFLRTKFATTGNIYTMDDEKFKAGRDTSLFSNSAASSTAVNAGVVCLSGDFGVEIRDFLRDVLCVPQNNVEKDECCLNHNTIFLSKKSRKNQRRAGR